MDGRRPPVPRGGHRPGRPASSLARLLRAASDRPGLAALDLGPRWTLLTWGTGSSVYRSRQPGDPWPIEALLRRGGEGGVVGWLGYEAGAACERMPPPVHPRRLPDVALWRVEGGLWLDRWTGRWRVAGSPGFRAEARGVLRRAEATSGERRFRPSGPAPRPGPAVERGYVDAVRRAKDAIRRGALYQVNLSWEHTGPATPDPVGAWLAIRRDNPARHGALLHDTAGGDDAWLVCNSPERFLRIRPGRGARSAVSVPIKGTVPVERGRAGLQHLRDSPKERAELTMIVDLVRNDLGRVARRGSVRAGHRRLVRCGDLWHAEQAVRCRLRPDVGLAESIGACFPPGSVTGAPKVAAMQAIGRLEPVPRGVYTGSVIFAGDDEGAWLNVAIRTATIVGGAASLHVGAGIVADSDPAAEWRETLAKGRVLARYVLAEETSR